MKAAATDTFGVFGTTAVILITEPAALGQARAIADPCMNGTVITFCRYAWHIHTP
jgi:hypothetical protein